MDTSEMVGHGYPLQTNLGVIPPSARLNSGLLITSQKLIPTLFKKAVSSG